MSKANILAAGVLLIALSLYLQVLYNQPEGFLKKTMKDYNIDENTFIYLTTIVFSAGLIAVVVSILIKPRRRIITPSEMAPRKAEEEYRKEVAYNEVEAIEKGEAGVEQAYEEAPVEEPYEAAEEAFEKMEEPGKVSEVIGFCPRCGAPVSEGMRYCRKCGLKLK